MVRLSYTLKCINCGGGPSNEMCDQHFYSTEEELRDIIAQLTSRVEKLEQGRRRWDNSNKPADQKPKPHLGVYKWKT